MPLRIEVPPEFAAPIERAALARLSWTRGRTAEAQKKLLEAWGEIAARSRGELHCCALDEIARAQWEGFWAGVDDRGLDHAIEIWQRAPLAGVSPGMRAAICNGLAVALRERFGERGLLADLDASIVAGRAAVSAAPDGTDAHAVSRSTLGASLAERAVVLGRRRDARAAIAHHSQAIRHDEVDSAKTARRRQALAAALSDLYSITGDTHDLDHALVGWQHAAAQPGDQDTVAATHNGWGRALAARYVLTGSLDDLDRTIATWRRGLRSLPEHSRYRPALQHSLANGLWDRYVARTRTRDLNETLTLLRQAFEATPATSPDRPLIANSLANALRSKALSRPGRRAFDEAVEVARVAAREIEADDPRRFAVVNGLANALADRFERLGAYGDLDECIEAYAYVIGELDSSSPHAIGALNNHARALMLRYAASNGGADIDAALASWSRAWKMLQSSVGDGALAYRLGHQRQAVSMLMDYVDALMHRGRRRDLVRAFVVAESSKSRLLLQRMAGTGLRAPDFIPAALRRRERELLDELEVERGRAWREHAGVGTTAGDVERIERALRNLWRTMARHGPPAASYARLRTGRLPDVRALSARLDDGTALISLFMSRAGTAAFILRSGDTVPTVVRVPLESLRWDDILRRFDRELANWDGSEETWWHPLRGLIESLSVHLEGCARVFVAPEDGAHRIPWPLVFERHGVGDSRRLSIRTIPTLGLVEILDERRPSAASGRPLVVGDAGDDLPDARDEAARVAELLGVRPLLGAEATRGAVMSRIADAAIVHIACHARLEEARPLDSRIELADGGLLAAEIISMSLDAELVVLSACDSGVPATLGGDELAGLAMAFLHAGAHALVVSLWPVEDRVTAALMCDFHERRMRGLSVATALSEATAVVRTTHPHPYYWAAFTVVGETNGAFSACRAAIRTGCRTSEDAKHTR